MQISFNVIQSTTNIQECMTMHELKEATSQDQHLQHLMEYVIKGWPDSKTNYHNTSEHTRSSDMMWQLLIG